MEKLWAKCESPTQNRHGCVYVQATRLESNLTLAMKIQATALAMVASKPLARWRLRLSQAMVRSTTHRQGSRSKPLAASDRLTISRVHRSDVVDGPSTFWDRWQADAVEESNSEGPSMGEVMTISLDLAKTVFQVHGIAANGKILIRRQL
jgi:hypothetical protein